MKFITVTSLVVVLLLSVSCSEQAKKRRYMTRGNQLFQQAKYEEAALAYRQAIRIDVGNGEAHYRLALAEIKLQEFVQAVPALQRATVLLPKNNDVRAELGRLYLRSYLGDPDRPKIGREAVERIAEQLLQHDQRSADAFRLKGFLAKDAGKVEEAKELLQMAN